MLEHFISLSINQHLLLMCHISHPVFLHIVRKVLNIACGRSFNEHTICTFYPEAEVVLKCAKAMELDEEVQAFLKPPQCGTCQSRVPDSVTLQSHVKSHHAWQNQVTGAERASMIHPTSMKVNELKKELKARGASLSGNKYLLIKRLEGLLSSEPLQIFSRRLDLATQLFHTWLLLGV